MRFSCFLNLRYSEPFASFSSCQHRDSVCLSPCSSFCKRHFITSTAASNYHCFYFLSLCAPLSCSQLFLALSLTLTNARMHAHTHTQAHMHSHTHTPTHTRTHRQRRCHVCMPFLLSSFFSSFFLLFLPNFSLSPSSAGPSPASSAYFWWSGGWSLFVWRPQSRKTNFTQVHVIQDWNIFLSFPEVSRSLNFYLRSLSERTDEGPEEWWTQHKITNPKPSITFLIFHFFSSRRG